MEPKCLFVCFSACGGDFTARNGAFTSPGYPNSYPQSTECVWTIQVAPGNRVQVSFRFVGKLVTQHVFKANVQRHFLNFKTLVHMYLLFITQFSKQ